MTGGPAARARGVAVGLVLADLAPPVPDEVHPVARFGSVMTAVEQRIWRDDRAAGAAYAAAGLALGALGGRAMRSTTAAVSVTAAGGQLRSVARDIAAHLEAGRLDAARAALPALVGRDPSRLDPSGIAAAVIESVAENMVDAVFAPALWALVAGPAGAGALRAVNTMDAMVGRRSERYERFGWAAARADDLANLVPARVFAAAVLAVAPAGRRTAVVRAVRDDAPAHPSPNAGVAEAAVAGALGLSLGGPLRYGDRHEIRPTLGDGPRPGAGDIERAVRLAERTELLLAGTAAALGVLGPVLRRRRR
ncbi:MAG TPA: cobalamin biosynthesis protein [Acidimicrobiales bacterium]|nr:cobalamin biosynthesis protein [Acidimicrobiales bacterium]